MFLKFTRLDGSPIWINATFVVTVEPRRGGGSIVVPIGDGLDYDVREAPEHVLAMLQPAGPAASGEPPSPEAVAAELARPAAVVEPVAPVPEPLVAVPPPKALPEKFEDVVSQSLSAPQAHEVDTKPAVTITVSPEPAPAKKTRAKRKTKAEAAGEGAEEKPKKTTRAKRKTKAEGDDAAPEDGEPAAAPEPIAAPAPAPAPVQAMPPAEGLDEAQVERLRRMAPGSVKKLQNTLVSQFRVADPQAVVRTLVETGVLRLENNHVVW